MMENCMKYYSEKRIKPIHHCFVPLFLILFILIILTCSDLCSNKKRNRQKNITEEKMSEMENFYIHLNSDVHRSSPLQVGNTIGNFVTRLNRRYNLSEDY